MVMLASRTDDDLTLYILNGLGSDFREIATPIREREKPLAFEELHDLLVGHDAYLRRLETTTRKLVASTNYSNRHLASSSGGQHSKGNFNGQHKYTPKCQIYDELGHIAKHCPRLRFVEPTANYVATSPATNPKWLIDSGASHNITGDLANLSIHSEYDGTDEVVIGDGSVRTLSYAILLVYVDDLVITGNNLCFVSEIVAQLGNWFSLKDMGQLNFFLGKEAISTKSGLFFSQHKYIRNLLSKTNMIGAKDVSTPLSTTTSLKLVDGTSSTNSTEFRSVIGALQYLSLTRPDISFSINKLS
ncbi:hypothetical protein VitviT2T_020032 [Vitis vinifera]|uniref:Reverse transcriptase Ty1/copia-type domain-containing protein n=1 Tax=Vitis vinifera TaxID=29760 RepID=A0ABY9D328_VITVI|nr:hypothetical protein VitviT2T_020032 [Vitis vinifera]